jgi:hypothetical protein
MAITTYADLDGNGFIAGQLYKSIVNGAKLTGYNDGAVVLPAGFGAIWTGTGLNVTLPASAAGKFAGVLTIPQVEVRASYSLDASSRFGWPVDYEVALAQTDMYVVYVDDTVAIGDAVYLNHTASTSVIGTFRNDVNSSNAQLIAGARFMSAAVGTSSTLALAVVNFSAN